MFVNFFIMKKVFCSILAIAAVTVFVSPDSTPSSLLVMNVDALSLPELSDHEWDRYDYTNENGTPGVNCLEGGSDDCLIHVTR